MADEDAEQIARFCLTQAGGPARVPMLAVLRRDYAALTAPDREQVIAIAFRLAGDATRFRPTPANDAARIAQGALHRVRTSTGDIPERLYEVIEPGRTRQGRKTACEAESAAR